MTFLIWHILAILTVMTGSFLIGYSVATKEDRKNFTTIEKIKNIFRK